MVSNQHVGRIPAAKASQGSRESALRERAESRFQTFLHTPRSISPVFTHISSLIDSNELDGALLFSSK